MPWTARALRILVGLGAAYYLFVVIAIACRRIGYPFELEWMEGGSLQQVVRLLSGEPLYVKPSLAFIPYIYPPVYYYVAAAVAKVLGATYLPLRLVSLASSIGCMFVIYGFCRREGASRLSSFVAVGLFAATYRLGGAWFDIARVDMLALLLFLAGIWLMRSRQTRSLAAAGVLLSLSVFTKQTMLLVVGPVILYLAIARLKDAVPLLLTFTGVTIILFVWLDRSSMGWFRYYVLDLPRQHSLHLTLRLVYRSFLSFFLWDLLASLPIAFLLGIVYLAVGLSGLSSKVDWLFFLVLAAGTLGMSWAGILNQGGFRNVIVPAYAIMSIMLGLGLDEILRLVAQIPSNLLPLFQAVVLGACALQFAVLLFPIAPELPTENDRQAGEHLLETIQNARGEVFIPLHPEYAFFAGKKTFANYASILELEGAFSGRPAREWAGVLDEFHAALEDKRFGVIILDMQWQQPEIERLYYPTTWKYPDESTFLPVTGWQVRPNFIYRPIAGGP